MKKILISLAAVIMSALAHAAGPSIPLDSHPADVRDTNSLQRGLGLYMSYCMGCHGLEYARYNRVARDLSIPEDIFEEYLMFTDARIGDLMTIAMSAEDGRRWFGAPPPDLTLVNRVRGSDWLYTYLRAFYADSDRPFGVNNAVFENVGMPHVLLELQGLCASAPVLQRDAKIDPLSGNWLVKPGCQEYLIEGSMTPVQFDRAVADIVNFLDYVGEPFQLERQRIGFFVLAFLFVFLFFTILLYREYWKDAH